MVETKDFETGETSYDPDLSRDNKLKQVFRNTFNWYFEQKKPTLRSEKPWWRPDSIEDGWFGQDPIQDPRTKYDFENQFNYRYEDKGRVEFNDLGTLEESMTSYNTSNIMFS